jgi:hypothetical protein
LASELLSLFFEPLQLHLQPADLLEQLSLLGLPLVLVVNRHRKLHHRELVGSAPALWVFSRYRHHFPLQTPSSSPVLEGGDMNA